MAQDESTRVVVLGGGIGGQVAATRLKQSLGSQGDVTMVERAETFTFAPSLLWLMVGKRTPSAISRDYARLRKRGVRVVQAEVSGIDTEAQVVRTDGGSIGYDYLVVALGAELDPGRVPGLAEHTHHPYDLASARRLHEALATFSGGRVVLSIASLPYKCPAAPYETAMLVEAYLRERGLRASSSVDVYTPEPLPMPVAGPHVGHSVAAELTGHGITLHAGLQLTRAEPGTLVFGEQTVPADLAIVIPPHRAPAVVRESGLTGPTGWIPVDRHSLRARDANVYAIGDIAAIPLENGMVLPKAGVFAHGQAEVVAKNIARRVHGDLREDVFDGHGTCFLETGAGKSGMARGDFFASPVPDVSLHHPGRIWHAAKVAYEQYWLRRWL